MVLQNNQSVQAAGTQQSSQTKNDSFEPPKRPETHFVVRSN
ncbi:MAG: hypothetical protein JWM87_3150 [Candidatus Eremiobacteraeota bacterium]|nr:hypothetical protein [Candidatus Eremiobacteraeota bacterium]